MKHLIKITFILFFSLFIVTSYEQENVMNDPNYGLVDNEIYCNNCLINRTVSHFSNLDSDIEEYEFKKEQIVDTTGAFRHSSTTGTIIHHRYFSLSYSEKDKQSEWVAYKITSDNFKSNIERTNDYREDPKIKVESAERYDYKGSGYDMGHLAPAATMSHNLTSMSESFYLSNVSPQKPSFNRGIWKRLEEKVRYWSFFNDSTFVVTGPILVKSIDNIGSNEVTVPNDFYKAIISFNNGNVKGIAFLMPNKSSNKSIYSFVTNIDEIEKITGIDFYNNLELNIQKRVESNKDLKSWIIND